MTMKLKKKKKNNSTANTHRFGTFCTINCCEAQQIRDDGGHYKNKNHVYSKNRANVRWCVLFKSLSGISDGAAGDGGCGSSKQEEQEEPVTHAQQSTHCHIYAQNVKKYAGRVG